MDIRNFFGTPLSKTAKLKPIQLEKSDDEEPLPKVIRMRKVKKNKAMLSESDEEFLPDLNNKILKETKQVFNHTKKAKLDNHTKETTPVIKARVIPIKAKKFDDEIQKLKIKKKDEKSKNVKFVKNSANDVNKNVEANLKKVDGKFSDIKKGVQMINGHNNKSICNDPIPKGDFIKKRESGLQYNTFLQREGPRALGTRKIPEGKENCFEGLTFVVTGILETIDRDKCKELIEMYGGKITQSISKKTSYVVVGREPGPSKIQKAISLQVKQINEDAFFNLLATLPGKESKYLIYQPPDPIKMVYKKENKQDMSSSHATDYAKTFSSKKFKRLDSDESIQSTASTNDATKSFKKMKKPPKIIPEDDEIEIVCDENNPQSSTSTKSHSTLSPTKKVHMSPKPKIHTPVKPSLMWVDKHKPITTSDIIGQQGDKSSLHKLMSWLGDWFYHHGSTHASTEAATTLKGSGKKGGGFGAKSKDQDGGNFKAALLSGPPGVGKTTSAILACKELGYTYTELNASNIRSKKCLKDLFSESLATYNMSNYIKGVPSQFKNHALIMDEVDGMAGNEDRGGVQELIALIKTTKLPIICICNERKDPKMRTLVNYCYDLRFFKPRAEQIKEAIMQILYSEKVTIEPAIVQRVIAACNNDIRQVIHSLSMFTSDNKSLRYMNLANEIKDMKKDTKLDVFEITRTVFSSDVGGKDPIRAKSDLFFMDYSLVPLFIQENYLHVQPFAAQQNKGKHLDLITRAADFMSDADLMAQVTQKTNNWGMLPLMAISSTVAPGEIMKGYFGAMINFPKFFGKLSKRNKFHRMLKELKMHMMLRTFCDWSALNLDYMTSIKNELSLPLIPGAYNASHEENAELAGIQKVLKTVNFYYLLKEDMDNVVELTKWDTKHMVGGKHKHKIVDTYAQINSKVKGALTRAYTKSSFMIPYVMERNSDYGMVRKSGRNKAVTEKSLDFDENLLDINDNGASSDAYESDQDEPESSRKRKTQNEDPDFITNDKMIKKKVITKKAKINAKGKKK